MHNITPIQALDMLQKEQNVLMIDVRTKEEWGEEGIPDLDNQNKLLLLSLYLGRERSFNQSFVDDFNLYCHNKDMKLLFICKSGYRSSKALELISNLGYDNCFNVEGGFEEWKKSNLPYKIEL